jgi:hypothetical protein
MGMHNIWTRVHEIRRQLKTEPEVQKRNNYRYYIFLEHEDRESGLRNAYRNKIWAMGYVMNIDH